MKTRTCKDCVYFSACGDVDRTEPCNGRFIITKEQAKEFYRDLCGTIYGNSNVNSQGTMTVELIAEHMDIDIPKANFFCDAMIKYKITERQNGMIVV